MWDVIVLIPDHCLSIYFTCSSQTFIFTDLSIRYIDMVNVSCLLLASVRSDLFGGGSKFVYQYTILVEVYINTVVAPY